MNLVKKYLLDVSPVPFARRVPMTPTRERLVATMKHGVEAQPILAKPTIT